MKGINIFETKPYILKEERGKENPTIFHICALDNIVRAYIEDQTSNFGFNPVKPEQDAQVTLNLALEGLLRVKFGVKKIENLIDPRTNQPVQYEPLKVKIAGMEYEALPDEILKIIPGVGELANAILTANTLSEEEAKN